jgi:hypothetical protein
LDWRQQPFSTCNRNIAEDRASHIAGTHPNFGAGYSQKGKRIYEVKYTVGEIGRIRVVEDFLPASADLVLREDNVKVTLSLSRRSLDFFKREARKRHVPY